MLATGVLAFSEAGSNIISPDGSLLFILVLFLTFVFVLNRILFRPIGRVLDEREAVMDGEAKEARAAAHQYNSQLAEYEDSIRRARAEGYQRVEQQRAQALQQRQSLIDQAKGEAARELEKAKAEIEQQSADARTALAADAQSIATQISSTVLGRAVGGRAD